MGCVCLPCPSCSFPFLSLSHSQCMGPCDWKDVPQVPNSRQHLLGVRSVLSDSCPPSGPHHYWRCSLPLTLSMADCLCFSWCLLVSSGAPPGQVEGRAPALQGFTATMHLSGLGSCPSLVSCPPASLLVPSRLFLSSAFDLPPWSTGDRDLPQNTAVGAEQLSPCAPGFNWLEVLEQDLVVIQPLISKACF